VPPLAGEILVGHAEIPGINPIFAKIILAEICNFMWMFVSYVAINPLNFIILFGNF
jgi:hypothetical protein